MLSFALDKLAELLASAPDPVLNRERVGMRKPSGSGDLPMVVITLRIDSQGHGIGNFIREGNVLAESTRIVQVQPSPDSFNENLTALRLSPLPFRRNPAATEPQLTELDVGVENVTVQPERYRLAVQPTEKDEYCVDVARALILFGRPQTPGDNLRIVHWTTTWRDDISGWRYKGTAVLEIWSSSPDEATRILRALTNKLAADRTVLRQKSFLELKPLLLEPMELISQELPHGASLPAWKQKLEYRFTVELERGGEISSGAPIRRIDVEMDDQLVERFAIQ